MALKKHISYQWRLFIPLITTLWALIIGMALWQANKERNYQADKLRAQLSLINDRIIDAYETEFNPQAYFKFVSTSFQKMPEYDLIRISVYKDKSLIYNIGEIVSLTDDEISHDSGLTTEAGEEDLAVDQESDHSNDYFYYKATTSDDGRLEVLTAVPVNDLLRKASLPDYKIWVVLVVLVIFLTILSYYTTRYLGTNVRILRDFAVNAANDRNYKPDLSKVPHDELGEITRQIAHMHTSLTQALENTKREHEVALHAMNEKARLKRQLTNNINHELKTPVGVIKGYLDTITENPDMDSEARDRFILKAQEHVNRLVNLMNDVSSLTRLDEGSSIINTEEIDFHDVVYSVVSDCTESGMIGELSFVYDIPLNCRVNGNFNLLTGMLNNLVKNARLHSKGTECGIKLIGEDAKFYTFAFYDNGVGVSEEHIPHLFDRFYRVDSGRTRKAGGTGLGLPIVQNTVLAHGGTIEISNRPEGGLQFTFTLPKALKHTGS